MFKNIENIIFDIDGTLVNTEKFTVKAFERVLKQLKDEGLLLVNIDEKDILKYIGYTIDQIWENLLKTHDKIVINKAIKYLDKHEQDVLNDTKEIFFDGVFEVLKYLKSKNKKLFLLSNCNIHYMELILEKGLKEYIDYPHCAEMYNWKQKDYVISTFIKEHKTKDFVMIGDRNKDIEAAIKNNVKSIGCNYGYGYQELDGADYIIKDIKELLNLF